MKSRLSLIAKTMTALATITVLGGCAAAVPTAGSPSTSAPATTTKSAPTTTVTACGLVTEQDATKALGSDPGAGATVSSRGATSCTFGQYPLLLTVNVITAGGKADLAHLKSEDKKGSMTPLAGLADSAFVASNGPVASVWFSHNDTLVVIVDVGGSTGGPFTDQAKGVARAALARL